MMARLRSRFQASRASAWYRRLDGSDDDCGLPWTSELDLGRPEIRDGDRTAAADTDGLIGRGLVERHPVERHPVERKPVETAATDLGAAGPGAAALAGTERASPGRAPAGADLLRELQRVADSFERIAASLDRERREHAARLDAVEIRLRELMAGVTGLSRPTAVPPVVVGGSIDLSDPALDTPIDAIAIDDVPEGHDAGA